MPVPSHRLLRLRLHLRPRPSSLLFILLGLLALGLVWSGWHAHEQWQQGQVRLAHTQEWVRTLSLTDLALFTEAHYTRHPSLADWHTPFQSHPGALEHFPSGSLVPPPLWLWQIDP